MGGVVGFFVKELKNSWVGILKESENIHVWFQNCYSVNNLVLIYTKSTDAKLTWYIYWKKADYILLRI